MSTPRVLAFGGFDRGAGYPRADALLAGLTRRGVSVIECRVELPFSGSAKRRLLRSPWLWPRYWFQMRRARRHAEAALRRAIAECQPDVVLVPYPGHLVVHWARAVWDGPLVLDLFLSVFDTAVLDRRMFSQRSPFAGFLRRVDRRACVVADRILVDTDANAAFLADLVGLPCARFAVVHVSDPGQPEVRPTYSPPQPGERLEVLFFGTGVPLHGLGHLIDAVARCPGVRLTIAGGSSDDREHGLRLPAGRVRLLDKFVPLAQLRQLLEQSHLVAGIFGTSAKADRVVPFKVVHALAAGRPVITGRTRAAVSALQHGVEAELVACGDSRAIAAAVQRLAMDPDRLAAMAAAGRAKYERQFALEPTGAALLEALRGVLSDGSPEAPSARPPAIPDARSDAALDALPAALSSALPSALPDALASGLPREPVTPASTPTREIADRRS